MYGSPFLSPLALMVYLLVVVALGYMSVHVLGQSTLAKKVPGNIFVALPTPASTSRASFSSTVLRAAKTALSVKIPLSFKRLPRVHDIRRLLTRKWTRRITLDQLPTTAFSDDDEPLPPRSRSGTPVLVDLTETSNVSTPIIPMRVLGTANLPIRSPTPLLSSRHSVLVTPRLAEASTASVFPVDSPPLPRTPPPHPGTGHHFEPVSPFSSPPFKSSKDRAALDATHPPRSPNVIYPQSRSRTPSPISSFLSTSPAPLAYHRRTRSLGGVNVRRVSIPNSTASPFIEAAKAGVESIGLNALASRSTELLISLEDGAMGVGSLDSSSPHVEETPVDDWTQVESSPSASSLQTLDCSSIDTPADLGFPLLGQAFKHDDTPKVTPTNNAWRQWACDDDPFADDSFKDQEASLNRIHPDDFPAEMKPQLQTSELTTQAEPLVMEDGLDAPQWADERVGDAADGLVGDVDPWKAREDSAPSQMPTPPASPPFALRHLHSPIEIFDLPSGESNSESLVEDDVEAPLSKQPNIVEETADAQCEADEDDVDRGPALSDDPPLPEIPCEADVLDSKPIILTKSLEPPLDLELSEFEDESDDDSENIADDPPLPSISDMNADETNAMDGVPTTISTDKSRPAWSIRAEEAPRLGLVADEVAVSSGVNGQKDAPKVESDTAVNASEVTPLATCASPRLPNNDAVSQLRRRVVSSTIDTSSFAAAIVSLRRKPEPLDVALLMQMRPGLGFGADPAWMVRFIMAVFGWIAITVSAGID